MSVYLGLDIGSTRAKCVAFTQRGEIVASHVREYSKDSARRETDPEAMFAGAIEALSACAAVGPRAVAVSSFGESFVPVDKRGRALAGIPMYSNGQGAREAALIDAKLGAARVREITGLKPGGIYALPKLISLMARPDFEAEKLHKILFIADYIAYRLTGVAATPPSLASRSMALDVNRLSWSEEVLSAAGLTSDIFPEIVPSGARIGRILPSIADMTGLSRELTVCAGAHDQIAAALGAGAIAAGDAVNGSGTVDCLTPVFEGARALTDGFALVPHAAPGMFATYAFCMNGGSAFGWFRQFTANASFEELERACPDEIGPELVIPHFSGTGTPELDERARASICNLSLSSSAGSVYRALMEGVAFELRHNLEALEACCVKRPRAIRIAGGASASRKLMEIKSDVLRLCLNPLCCPEAGAAGGAMLAAIQAGEFASLDDACRAFVRPAEAIYPNPARMAAYDEKYAEYARLRAAAMEQALS